MPEGAQISKKILIAVIFIPALLADQITKAMVTALMEPYSSSAVIPGFFNVVNVNNPGAAFGIFGGSAPAFLIIVSLLALGLMAYMLKKASRGKNIIALLLIASGAAGNLLDRVRFGMVVDFLDFFVGTRHWPAFNVADIAITVGVLIYLLSIYGEEKGAR